MKIVRLTAENIKKLRAVEITPDGDIVTISGRNGQGKTSVLDSIFWAMGGTKNIQDAPIRKGETKARIRLDLGDLVVERTFTEKGSALSVESADGARFPSPQTMLDALVGQLSFDPLAFARMDPKKQAEELRRVAKLDVDIDHLRGLNRSDFDKRTEVNRSAKAARASAASVKIPPKPEVDRVDERAIVDELQAAGEQNAALERRRENRKSVEARVEYLRGNAGEHAKRSAEMRAAADRLDAEAAAWIQEADGLAKKIADAEALPDPVDVSAVRARVDAAKEHNAAIDAFERAATARDTYAGTADALEKTARDLTEKIEGRELAIKDAIQRAAMPVAGLGFGDGHVTFNDLPFDQASSAEQLRVSMAIAMAANPKLRVIRITDGSLLDEDSLKTVAEMAKGEDFQVWIETVDSTGMVGVVIEDGAVASTPETREVEARLAEAEERWADGKERGERAP